MKEMEVSAVWYMSWGFLVYPSDAQSTLLCPAQGSGTWTTVYGITRFPASCILLGLVKVRELVLCVFVQAPLPWLSGHQILLGSVHIPRLLSTFRSMGSKDFSFYGDSLNSFS